MSWTGIKRALQQPFKRNTTGTNFADDSSEFAYLEAQFRQKRESLDLLIKNIDAYPKQVREVLGEAQGVVEGLREILKKAQMDGRPSVWLGYSQKALVALLSLERDIFPLLDDRGDLTGQLVGLRKEYSEVLKKIQGRNSALLALQNAAKKREPKLRMQFELLDQQLRPDLVRFLRKSEGLVQMTLNQQVAPFQERLLSCWGEALGGLELLNEPILHEELGPAITKIRSCLARIPSCRYIAEGHYHCPESPLDVPTEGIAAEAPGSPKIQYKITMGSKDQLLLNTDDAEEEQSKPISELRKSFEQLHVLNAPSTRAPELPSGQSRVAALAAQLEASKIIFRPMTPTARPKPQRDTLDEAEEEGVYERNLGRPNPRGYGVSGKAALSHLKRKQEVPPKPPQKTYVYAMHDFGGIERGDLQFRRGDKVELLVGSGQAGVVDWWTGRLQGAVGLFPSNYVRKL